MTGCEPTEVKCKCECHKNGYATLRLSNPPKGCCDCYEKMGREFFERIEKRIEALEQNALQKSFISNENHYELTNYIDNKSLVGRIEALEEKYNNIFEAYGERTSDISKMFLERYDEIRFLQQDINSVYDITRKQENHIIALEQERDKGIQRLKDLEESYQGLKKEIDWLQELFKDDPNYTCLPLKERIHYNPYEAFGLKGKVEWLYHRSLYFMKEMNRLSCNEDKIWKGCDELDSRIEALESNPITIKKTGDGVVTITPNGKSLDIKCELNTAPEIIDELKQNPVTDVARKCECECHTDKSLRHQQGFHCCLNTNKTVTIYEAIKALREGKIIKKSDWNDFYIDLNYSKTIDCININDLLADDWVIEDE